MAFSEDHNRATADRLPLTEHDYLILVEASGRAQVHGKRGRIDPSLATILERLGLTAGQWTTAATAFERHHRNRDLRLTRSA